jgi:hypothetical protein
MHRFEIDKNGAVSIFCETAGEPIIYQPTWPNGVAWKKGEAETWAENYLLALVDPEADLAGDSPENPTKPRPTEEAPELTEG